MTRIATSLHRPRPFMMLALSFLLPTLLSAQPAEMLLSPTAGTTIQEVFARHGLWGEAATLALQGGQARGTLESEPEGERLQLSLSAHGPRCKGEVMGCCCIERTGSKASLAVEARLHTALTTLDAKALFITLPASDQPLQEEEPDEGDTVTWGVALTIGLGLLLAAVLAGLLVGGLLRWAPPKWRAVGLALAVGTTLAFPFVCPVNWLLLGVWDPLMAAMVFALCAIVWAQYRPSLKNLGLLALSLLMALAGLEGGSRLLTPPRLTASTDDTGGFPLTRPNVETLGDPRAQLLYPDRFPEVFNERIALATSPADIDAPVILHLGDSIVHGNSVNLEETFVSHLGHRDFARTHFNAGIQGVGPDYEYLLFTQLVERLRIKRVVLYLFAGNDLFEAGMRYPFCNQARLLDWHGADPVWQCPEPGTIAHDVRYKISLAPLLLRVLATDLMAPRHLLRAIEALRMDSLPEDEALSVVKASLAALKQETDKHQMGLTVVVIPDRTELLQNYEQARRRRLLLLAAAQELGLNTLDPEPFLRSLVQQPPTAQWFEQEMAEDVHWSRQTHERFADWLLPQLQLGL